MSEINLLVMTTFFGFSFGIFYILFETYESVKRKYNRKKKAEGNDGE